MCVEISFNGSKLEYGKGKIKAWLEGLKALSKISKNEPQARYSCFVSVFKHDLNYMREDSSSIHLQLFGTNWWRYTELSHNVENSIIINAKNLGEFAFNILADTWSRIWKFLFLDT